MEGEGEDSTEKVDGSRVGLSFLTGKLEGNTASRSGSSIVFALPRLVGMEMLFSLLSGGFIMLPRASKPLFSTLKASLVRMAGSIVSSSDTSGIFEYSAGY